MNRLSLRPVAGDRRRGLPSSWWYIQQRTRWSSPTLRSSGCARSASTLPVSTRVRQRGAKRQPSGSSMRLGTEPGMVASSSRISPGTGTAPMSPRV